MTAENLTQIETALVDANRNAAPNPRQLQALERIIAQREVPLEFIEALVAVTEGKITATSEMVAQTIRAAQTYPYRQSEAPTLVQALAAHRQVGEEIAREDAEHVGSGEHEAS